MERKKLQELFCMKIYIELERYKHKMFRLKSEEIFHRAYEIDCIVSIYEALKEMSLCMTREALQLLLVLPHVLALFFRAWMDGKGSSKGELENVLSETLEELCDQFEKITVQREKIAWERQRTGWK